MKTKSPHQESNLISPQTLNLKSPALSVSQGNVAVKNVATLTGGYKNPNNNEKKSCHII